MSSQRFTFVNVTAPQDASSEGNKKRIRSAAAASGWAQGARPKLPPNLPNNSENPRFSYPVDLKDLFESPEKSDLSDHPASIDKPSTTSDTEPASNHFSGRKFIWETASGRRTSTAKYGATEVDDRSRSNIKRKRTPRSSQTSSSRRKAPVTSSSVSVSSQSLAASPTTAVSTWISTIQTPDVSLSTTNSALASPHDLGSGIHDAFNCYPVQSQLWCDMILHHMMTVFAPRGWDSLHISNEEGLKWERFMTQHALADPALFNVRLLFASGDLIRLRVLPSETALWLRDQAVRSINEALDDPVRAISDPVILAVGRIALHESMYGDRGAANLIHRPAQHRMIMMRGGMGALEFPELVKRLMRWADRVMSLQSDTPRFLPDTDQSFSINQSVEVLEKWVPQEGLSLRTKVRT
ncbi:hypothetical protein E4T44_07058 [Aureobasidium sp. EXF-8845]|nr:hypothetical protein E4T44_07058 [Aureobasidium sp. EXF-8845]KAI4846891.1 hypothetical protein E4T45_07039 [Aureobasidium sp. EXF-8846]